MCIRRCLTASVLLLLAFVWGAAVPFGTHAATIEEEEGGDEELFEAPTPLPAKAKPATIQASATAVSKNTSPAASSGDFQGIKADDGTSSKARINRNLSFYYFLRSGYVVSDSSEIPCLGEVVEANGEMFYSTPKKLFVRLISPNTEVKPGDLWVVYRAQDQVREPKSGFSGIWANNLAVVKVLEVQKQRCQAEVKNHSGLSRTATK
jgi:hypothetical protein